MKNYLNQNKLPEENREWNRKLEEAFRLIQITIAKIQGFQEDESLRYFVYSDHRKNPKTVSTIEQVSTRFCIISLGADEIGRFSIAISIDVSINEKIGRLASAGLLRRLFESTPGACEAYVVIHSFSQDCDKILYNIINEYEAGVPWHQLKVTPMNHI